VTARLVIAGTSSGAGKTSIACGLIGALRAAGHVVQACKVGPDYIDPSYHALASGRPGRNLDAFIAGPELVAPLLAGAVRPATASLPTGVAAHDPALTSQTADIVVIEGVMGLFDGASGRGELASTAHVAKLTDSPVVLVVDATAMSRSAAAVVHGFRSFDPDVQIAGVILNRVGSEHHEALLRDAIEPLGVPVLGAVRRSDRLATPERHLGLIPASEREAAAKQALDALAVAVSEHVELEALVRLARTAPPLRANAWQPPSWDHAPDATEPTVGDPRSTDLVLDASARPVRIAVASGNAFSFHYRENLESLHALGAELVSFDPTHDEALPEGADALLLAGGFPEVYGEALAANAPLRSRVAAAVRAGLPTVAECGGLLYLCDRLDDHAMCGVLPGSARMAGRLSLGYREAIAATASPLAAPGDELRGHEFHYSTVDPSCGDGDGSLASGPGAAWTLHARGRERREGFATATLSASYLHMHWAAFPSVPRRLVTAARSHAAARQRATTPA
jgi:cobyrinic acid a,c-diamide synthase